jgi:hypothetical protein
MLTLRNVENILLPLTCGSALNREAIPGGTAKSSSRRPVGRLFHDGVEH